MCKLGSKRAKVVISVVIALIHEKLIYCCVNVGERPHESTHGKTLPMNRLRNQGTCIIAR